MMRKAAVLYHTILARTVCLLLWLHTSISQPNPLKLSSSPTPFTAPSHPKASPLTISTTSTLWAPLALSRRSLPRSPNVVVLDHHNSQDRSWNAHCWDMNRSGATIAFDYFRSKLHVQGADAAVVAKFDGVWRLFQYIEDGDLWRWSLPNSKAFSSGFKDLNLQYDVGSNPSLFHQAVNADSISELRSELGHQLATKSGSLNLRGIGAVVYRVPELENDKLLKTSLRSVDSEDTTLISQEFGGGGHRKASSFMLGSAEFEQWKVGVISRQLIRGLGQTIIAGYRKCT